MLGRRWNIEKTGVKWSVPNQSISYLRFLRTPGWVGIECQGNRDPLWDKKIIRGWRENLRASKLTFTCLVGVIYNFVDDAFFRMTTAVWIFLPPITTTEGVRNSCLR